MSGITKEHVKTGFMLIMQLSMGLAANVVGPAMVDLTELTGANIEQLNRAIMFKSIGFVLGAPLGGYLAARFRANVDALIVVTALVHGVSCIVIPLVPDLIFMGFCFTLQGLGNAILNVTLTSAIILVWDEKSGIPIHAFKMAWSIGAAVSPLYTGPFLSTQLAPPNDGYMDQSDNLTTLFPISDNNSFVSYGQASRIIIPFGISGGVTLLGSAIFLSFIFFAPGYNSPRMREGRSTKEILASCNCKEKRDSFTIIMITSMFFLYTILVGRDVSLTMFIAPIAIESLHVPKTTAAIMATSFTAVGAVGRGSRSILSHYINIHIIVFTDVILCIVFCILLAIYGLQNAVAFWTLSCIAGFFGVPNYPSVLVWVNHYVTATGFAVTIVEMGMGTGWFTSTWVVGYLFEYYGPEYVLYLVAVSSCLMLIMLVPLQVLAIYRGDKHSKNKTREVPDDETSPLIHQER